MKARLTYLIGVFLLAWPLIAMHSCLPFSRYSATQGAAPMQSAHYRAGKFSEFTGFNRKPQVILLKRKGLHEISGIAASRRYKDVLYVHEDNGHPNCLYVTNNKGKNAQA